MNIIQNGGNRTAGTERREQNGGNRTAGTERREQNNKSRNFLEWCLAWEILIASGGVGTHSGFRNLPPHFMAALLLMTALGLYFMRPKVKADASTAAMIIIVVWTSINSIMFDMSDTSIKEGTGFSPDNKVYAAAMYLAVSALSFRHFREILLKALTYLSAATLIAWAIHIGLNVGSFARPPAPTFGIFMDWGGRMASIYWEPGQYQIIMIFTLVLFFDELRQVRFSRLLYFIRKFGIIILAIIVCRSTMGYLSLMMLMMLAFMFNSSAKKNKALYVLLLLIAIVLGVLIFSSEVVQNKIDARNLQRRSSFYVRLWDNIALWNMSFVSPMTGIGTTSEYRKYGKMYHDTTASNGWLRAAAIWGWPMLIMIVLCIISNLKRMKLGLPALFAFIPLFMSQSNENWLLFPIMYIYIYRFRDYIDYNAGRQLHTRRKNLHEQHLQHLRHGLPNNDPQTP